MTTTSIARPTAGKVVDLTLVQLGKLRLRQGAGRPTAKLTAYRIPTIEVAFDRIRGRILVDLDTNLARCGTVKVSSGSAALRGT